MEAVLEEDPRLAAALAAAEAAHEQRRAAAAAARQQAEGSEEEEEEGEGEEEEEDEEEEAQPAALRELGGGGGASEQALLGAEPSVPAWDAQRPGKRPPYQGQSLAKLRRVLRERAASRARSRLRFRVFRSHLNLDAWYEALHLFQEVLDRGVVWGPAITYTMLKAALDLQVGGAWGAGLRRGRSCLRVWW
jgi:hypothetical protein